MHSAFDEADSSTEWVQSSFVCILVFDFIKNKNKKESVEIHAQRECIAFATYIYVGLAEGVTFPNGENKVGNG